jgi:hypothetical protein
MQPWGGMGSYPMMGGPMRPAWGGGMGSYPMQPASSGARPGPMMGSPMMPTGGGVGSHPNMGVAPPPISRPMGMARGGKAQQEQDVAPQRARRAAGGQQPYSSGHRLSAPSEGNRGHQGDGAAKLAPRRQGGGDRR